MPYVSHRSTIPAQNTRLTRSSDIEALLGRRPDGCETHVCGEQRRRSEFLTVRLANMARQGGYQKLSSPGIGGTLSLVADIFMQGRTRSLDRYVGGSLLSVSAGSRSPSVQASSVQHSSQETSWLGHIWATLEPRDAQEWCETTQGVERGQG